MATEKSAGENQVSKTAVGEASGHEKVKAIKRPAHTPEEKGHKFKGYTLDEIRYMKVVNSLKINLVQDQIKMTFSPRITSEAKTVAGYMRYFETSMRYANIAVMAFSMFRRMRGWLGKNRQKK